MVIILVGKQKRSRPPIHASPATLSTFICCMIQFFNRLPLWTEVANFDSYERSKLWEFTTVWPESGPDFSSVHILPKIQKQREINFCNPKKHPVLKLTVPPPFWLSVNIPTKKIIIIIIKLSTPTPKKISFSWGHALCWLSWCCHYTTSTLKYGVRKSTPVQVSK